MTTKNDDARNEAAKDVAVGATTLAVAAATGVPLAVAGIAAVAGPIFGGAAGRASGGRNIRRVERWFVSMAHELGGDPDAVRARLEARMAQDGDKVATAVLESVDCLLRAADDAVVPSLGALAAKYIRDDKPADPFFRGVAGLLQVLSATALVVLR